MTATCPPIITVCPSCGSKIVFPCDRDQFGQLHPQFPFTTAFLQAHKDCDLYQIALTLHRAAFHLTHVQVYRICK